jgi:hypothetical protein
MTAAAAVSQQLAERARQLALEYPPRTHERRAAAALWVALATTTTTRTARRALAGFASPDTQAIAAALLDDWERDHPRAAPGP